MPTETRVRAPEKAVLCIKMNPARAACAYPQSNELTRAPPELVQQYCLLGVHKSVACPKFDMVWLYSSPIPVGWRGVISSLNCLLPAFAKDIGRGRIGTLWLCHITRFALINAGQVTSQMHEIMILYYEGALIRDESISIFLLFNDALNNYSFIMMEKRRKKS
jgi:hypothetical protein